MGIIPYPRERRWLQWAVGIGGIVPVAAGLFGVLFGFALTGEREISVSADSHFRYLSGLLLGLGLCFWATIPRIEERTTLFRFLTVIVVIGGLSRLAGLPSLAMFGGLFVELVVTPLLCLWQTRLAHRAEDEAALPAESLTADPA